MIDPPWRTSTYERPFIREGNYLVDNSHLSSHTDCSENLNEITILKVTYLSLNHNMTCTALENNVEIK